MNLQRHILNNIRDTFDPPFTGSIEQWASQSINLPSAAGYSIGGPFKASPWMIAPFRSLRDHNIRKVCIMGDPQSGKSLIAEIFVPYTVIHGSGNILWLHHTDSDSLNICETRINPFLASIQNFKTFVPTDKEARKKRVIRFPHLSLTMRGANESATQMRTIKTLVMDECWQYKEGIMANAEARTDAPGYEDTKKIVCTAQAGAVEGEWQKYFDKGIIFDLSWQCPQCKEHQVWEWSKLRPDGSYAGINCSSGSFDTERIAETAKLAVLECFHCRHQIADTKENRESLESEHYICTKADGDRKQHSYRRNSISRKSWADLVTKYLQAKVIWDTESNVTPLKEFYQKELSKAWDLNLTAKMQLASIGDYDIDAQWPEERHRFMTVDCQKDLIKLYVVIRSWDEKGNSRSIFRGWANTFEEVRELQLKYKVKDQKVGVDCGYLTDQVYRECIKYGHIGKIGSTTKYLSWIALRGSGNDFFYHGDPKYGKDRRLYAPTSYGDPGKGLYKAKYKCPIIQWANDGIKDKLNGLRNGKMGKKFQVPSADDEYDKMMNSERKVKEIEKRTGREKWRWKQFKANHAWDAESMNVLFAHMHGII